MSIDAFGYIYIFLVAISIFCRLQTVTIIMGCLTLFPAASAINLGSTTLIPATLYVPVFAARAYLEKQDTSSKKKIPRAGIYLLLFLLYGLIVTAVSPTLFSNQIVVIWGSNKTGAVEEMLNPGNGNLPQSLYVAFSVLCFFSAIRTFQRKGGGQAIINTVLFVSGFLLFWSACDLATYYTGTGNLLHFLKNANYSILDKLEIAGIKRLNGTFAEAAGYATYTTSIFAFVFSLFRFGYRPVLTGTLALSLSLCIVLSASTTGYVGLSIYLLWALSPSLYNFIFKGQMNTKFIIGIFAFASLIIGVFAYYFYNEGIPLIDQLIFHKAESSSVKERSLWNLTAWEAFLHSYGIGIGFGSTRASSLMLVLLSSTGVIGTLLYFLFILRSVRLSLQNTPTSLEEKAMFSCREGFIGTLICAFLSSAVIGSALFPFLFSGAIAGLKLHKASEQIQKKHTIGINSFLT